MLPSQRLLIFTAAAAVAAGSWGIAPRAQAMDPREAVQLLSRTGAGLSPREMAPLSGLTLEQAVHQMLAGVHEKAETTPPSWVNDPPDNPRTMQAMTPEERMERQRMIQMRDQELVGWWYNEMVSTDSPLTEHMTLFWHNHFTSSLQKVRPPLYMYEQNATLRQYALGNFGDMLHAIAKDPAMILYLDNQTNRAGAPNENFAREVMELFTLGIGNYSEKDIKESARAFTGWMVNPQTGAFFFNARQHDYGTKTFLGRTGNWNGDDILNIILQQPQTAVFVTQKLWKDLISDTPDAKEVARMAAIFRDSHYEIKPLVEAMLTSPAFRDPKNRGTLVKSPAELIVETVRTLGVPIGDGRILAQSGRQMGQALMDPPNVKGWPGGEAWINSETLLMRRQFLDRITRGNANAFVGPAAGQPGAANVRPFAGAAGAGARGPGAGVQIASAAGAGRGRGAQRPLVPNLGQAAGQPAAGQAMMDGQMMDGQGMDEQAMNGQMMNGQSGADQAARPARIQAQAQAQAQGQTQAQPLARGRAGRLGRGAQGNGPLAAGRAGRGGRGGRGAGRGNNAESPSMNQIYSEWQQAGMTDPAQLAQLLLPLDPVDPIPAADSPSERVEQLLIDPVYQLK